MNGRGRHVRFTRAGAVCVLGAALACTSPESMRERAGGPGADLGNRGDIVEMHEGARMYYQTDCVIAGFECEGPLPVFGPAAALE